MGFDKLLGDTLIAIFCLVVIKKIGIWYTAGFKKNGFGKGLLLGISFIVIGLAGAYIGNIGVDYYKLQLISVSNAILFMINMLIVGANEEITMRSLILNNNNIWTGIIIYMLVDWLALFVEQCFYGGFSVLSVQMSLGQGLIMILLGSIPPVIIALFLLRKSIIEKSVQS